MEFIAVLILIFTMGQLIVSLFNWWFPDRLKKEIVGSDRLVSILIPARNEAATIKACIQSILSQEHRNFEIIVGDDQSEDATADIVNQLARNDSRIHLVPVGDLPDNWMGKTHACSVISNHAKGDYLLFLDADVRIKGDMIADCLWQMKRYKLQLLTLFPHQTMITPGEKKSIPIVYYILLSLLPLRLVRTTRYPSLSAANGQFMLFTSSAYGQIKPHERVKEKPAEDIAIARLYKSEGLKLSCQVADERVSCRMYESYQDAVRGFGKNVHAFFGDSLLLAILFWFVTSLGFIPVYLATGIPGLCLLTGISVLNRIIVIRITKQPIKDQLQYLVHQQLSLGHFILQHIKSKFTGQYVWKGRTIDTKTVK